MVWGNKVGRCAWAMDDVINTARARMRIVRCVAPDQDDPVDDSSTTGKSRQTKSGSQEWLLRVQNRGCSPAPPASQGKQRVVAKGAE